MLSSSTNFATFHHPCRSLYVYILASFLHPPWRLNASTKGVSRSFLRGSNLTRNSIPRKTSLSLPPFYLRNEFVVRSVTLTNVRNRRGVNRKVGKFSFIAPRYFAAWSNGSRSKIRSRGGGDGRSTFFDVEAKGNFARNLIQLSLLG